MATVSWNCTTCGRTQPHRTVGTETEPKGRRFQTLECAVCKTSVKAYLDGNGYQENLETPDNEETA